MLKICCSSCKKEIVSPLLAEFEQTICPHCLKEVPVEDVIVYANGYSYHRTDLIKRLSYYKSLLIDTAKECELLESDPTVSPDSKKSKQRLLMTLEEMLAGARDRVRIILEEICPVNYWSKEFKGDGYLANLSKGGACIEVREGSRLPLKKTYIVVCFTLPGDSKPLAIKGTVAWTKPATKEMGQQLGVTFLPLEKEISEKLWSFISRFSTKIAC